MKIGRWVPTMAVAVALILPPSGGCSQQDPGQPPVGSINAEEKKDLAIPKKPVGRR